jgi:hypothetical protein
MPKATEHADEVPQVGPPHCLRGFQGIRVDDGGDRVRGIVEAVDELEAQCQEQGQTQ